MFQKLRGNTVKKKSRNIVCDVMVTYNLPVGGFNNAGHVKYEG
jgi:hypothetical protein